MKEKKNIIIGISGASGAIYGIRLLQILQEMDNINTHLIISKSANITIKLETDYNIDDIIKLADNYYNYNDISACISSGSFKTSAMIIAPCSVKTMSEIACGITSNLLSRSADVVLKERKKLVLMLRETPLHSGHIANMLKVSEIGGIIAPPVPAFYNHPKNLDDIINHSIGRVLDLLDIEHNLVKRWKDC